MLRYDGASNLVRRVAQVPAQPGLGGAWSFGYDGRDQLRSEGITRPDGATSSRSFDFDPSGNPTAGSSTSGNNAPSTWTRTFNQSNQETTLGWNEATQAFDKPLFAYDGNGNPTLYKGLAAAYDVRDRMTAWGRMRAGYRSDGKRAWKATLDQDGVETSCKYLLD